MSTEIARRREAVGQRSGRASGVSVWSIVGGAALVLAAAAVVVSLPDIKRYIKISRM